jgi:hypothetical protein
MNVELLEDVESKTREDMKHVENVLRHINNVRRDCELLGKRLMENGEFQLGLDLIGLGQIHDYSKIHNQCEFMHLRDSWYGKPEFFAALKSHVSTNRHHPESWHGIEDMPRVYVAEMVCDWKSRSSEFGSDVLAWVKQQATEKFQFSTKGRVYKEIKEFFGILLDRAF